MTNENSKPKTTKTYNIRLAKYHKVSAIVKVEATSASEAAELYNEHKKHYLRGLCNNDWEYVGLSECWGAQQIDDDTGDTFAEETSEEYSLVPVLIPPRLFNSKTKSNVSPFEKNSVQSPPPQPTHHND